MNRWLLSSGAIVSSAMALYSWTHPSAFNLTLLAAKSDQDLKPLPREIEGLYDRLLKKAQSVATHDQFAEAINTVAGIPKNSRSYGEAQQLQEDWTQELFQRASSQYKQANVGMAIWMLKAVPSTSQRYTRATELQQRWAKEWTALRQASAAKKQGDWKGVMSSLTLLKDSMLYQSFPAQEMLQQATANLYGGDQTLAQISAVPVDKSVTVPTLPSTTDLSAASLPPSSPASGLLIDRTQALAWAEPPALMADSSPLRMERSLPHSGMSNNAPSSKPGSLLAPEFVPLEWAPPALAPAMPNASDTSRPSVNSDSGSVGHSGSIGNSDGHSSDPSSSISKPSAVPPHPIHIFPGSIAPDIWMALPPIDLLSPSNKMPSIKGDRSIELQSAPISPNPMAWSKSGTEKSINILLN